MRVIFAPRHWSTVDIEVSSALSIGQSVYP